MRQITLPPARNQRADIKLPAAHNQRADEMWAIIEAAHVNFEGKTVLDLGCGHGDMLARAWRGGAIEALGMDAYSEICESAHNATAGMDGAWIMLFDINYLPSGDEISGDIVMCFSVLPYLNDPDATLHWIRWHSEVALIEVQYAGDGPGFAHIHNDNDMRAWLERVGWKSITPLGRTHTRIRDAWRTIWRCE